MKLKLSYLFAVMALLFSAGSFAQVDRSIGVGQYKRAKQDNKPVDFVAETAKYYQKELKLDDFQTAAVREIIEAEKDRLMELMNDKVATKDERKDRAKVIYDRIDAKTLPLLNAEQQKKYKELRKIEDDQNVDLESD